MQERKFKAGIAIYNEATKEWGLVSSVEEHCFFVSARLSSAGDLITETDRSVGMNYEDCRLATFEEKVRLQQALNRRHLLWNAYRRRIEPAEFTPKCGEYVRVSILGEDIIAGVFKRVDARGQIEMFCQLHKDGTLGYSQYETVGPATDYQFQRIGSQARINLADALAKCSVMWNSRRNCLEYVDSPISESRRRTYFYINEQMAICEVQDTGRIRDTKRIEVGNYFLTREKAEAVRQCFQAILRMESKVVAPSSRKTKR